MDRLGRDYELNAHYVTQWGWTRGIVARLRRASTRSCVGCHPPPKPAPQRSLQDFSVKDVWPCFAPTEGGIPADEVTERRAGENIGREMRLQWDP